MFTISTLIYSDNITLQSGVIPELRSLHIAMANIRNKKHSGAANGDSGVKVDAGRILLHWQKYILEHVNQLQKK